MTLVLLTGRINFIITIQFTYDNCILYFFPKQATYLSLKLLEQTVYEMPQKCSYDN